MKIHRVKVAAMLPLKLQDRPPAGQEKDRVKEKMVEVIRIYRVQNVEIRALT